MNLFRDGMPLEVGDAIVTSAGQKYEFQGAAATRGGSVKIYARRPGETGDTILAHDLFEGVTVG